MVTVAALSKAIERATMPAGSFCDGSKGYRFVDRAGASCTRDFHLGPKRANG